MTTGYHDKSNWRLEEFSPDIERDELNNDCQVDELAEDGAFRDENPWVADVRQQRRNVTKTNSDGVSRNKVKIEIGRPIGTTEHIML